MAKKENHSGISKKLIALTMLLVVVACAGIFALGYRNSLLKIDAFCGAIDGSTLTNDLPQLAEKFDVDLVGPHGGSQKLGLSIYIVVLSKLHPNMWLEKIYQLAVKLMSDRSLIPIQYRMQSSRYLSSKKRKGN
jgi:hypothetical protein